jgi:hypothetical protein
MKPLALTDKQLAWCSKRPAGALLARARERVAVHLAPEPSDRAVGEAINAQLDSFVFCVRNRPQSETRSCCGKCRVWCCWQSASLSELTVEAL